MNSYLDRTDSFMAALGVEAYRVGGSVRDQLLGRRVKDADYVVREVALDVLRRRIREVDPAAALTPLKLRDGRVVGVRVSKKGLGLIEIALPRTERKVDEIPEGGSYRHAFEIVTDPTITLDQDAVRRDFTINALYLRVSDGEIVDPLGGRADIESASLRTTHESSFRDDPLRTLRALRFMSVLGFTIADATRDEMARHADAVTGLTGKGVSGTALEELSKILMGDGAADALRVARDTGVLAALLPELAPMIGFSQESKYHDMTTDEHTFVAIDAAARMGCSLRVRMALLFHDAGKPESAWADDEGFLHFYGRKDVEGSEDHAVVGARLARAALDRLNADKKLRRDVPILIERHMVPLSQKTKPTKVRKWRTEIGDEMLADLLKHRLADCMGKGTVDYDAITALARLERIREEAVKAHVPASAKDMKDLGLIDGSDLIDMGVDRGKIGVVLAKILHEVVSDPTRMDREWVLDRAARLAGVA